MNRTRTTGYTIIELVLVIVIIGLLSAVAAPRFFSNQPIQARGFADEVAGALRYAHKLAVASGCEVQVSVSAALYTLNQHATDCTTGAFTRDVRHPGTAELSFQGAPPSGVVLSASVSPITFNALGQSSSASTVTAGGRTLQIVAETGLVYEP